jgi:hypothetical protein
MTWLLKLCHLGRRSRFTVLALRKSSTTDGLPDKIIVPLQRIQNWAARILSRTKKHPVLKNFRWLPVKQWIEFKILLMCSMMAHPQACGKSVSHQIIQLTSHWCAGDQRPNLVTGAFRHDHGRWYVLVAELYLVLSEFGCGGVGDDIIAQSLPVWQQSNWFEILRRKFRYGWFVKDAIAELTLGKVVDVKFRNLKLISDGLYCIGNCHPQ